jgi:hypothetical protein
MSRAQNAEPGCRIEGIHECVGRNKAGEIGELKKRITQEVRTRESELAEL